MLKVIGKHCIITTIHDRPVRIMEVHGGLYPTYYGIETGTITIIDNSTMEIIHLEAIINDNENLYNKELYSEKYILAEE
jgi:hypothetical protein